MPSTCEAVWEVVCSMWVTAAPISCERAALSLRRAVMAAVWVARLVLLSHKPLHLREGREFVFCLCHLNSTY